MYLDPIFKVLEVDFYWKFYVLFKNDYEKNPKKEFFLNRFMKKSNLFTSSFRTIFTKLQFNF
jgi:hypothetical protein